MLVIVCSSPFGPQPPRGLQIAPIERIAERVRPDTVSDEYVLPTIEGIHCGGLLACGL